MSEDKGRRTASRPHRRAAVARVDARTLRRIEAALSGDATCREWARKEVRWLRETAEWRSVNLPRDRGRT